jgi:hypothetical protein
MIRMLAQKIPVNTTVVVNLLLLSAMTTITALLTPVILLRAVNTRKLSVMIVTNVPLILVTPPVVVNIPIFPRMTVMLAL